MDVTKTFERKGKNHHERFVIKNGEMSYFVSCRNGSILNIRERITRGEDIHERWIEVSPLPYETLAGSPLDKLDFFL